MLNSCHKSLWNPCILQAISTETREESLGNNKTVDSQEAVVMVLTIVSAEFFKKFPLVLEKKSYSDVVDGDDILWTDTSHGQGQTDRQTAETLIDYLWR